jgi:hypothetical protein
MTIIYTYTNSNQVYIGKTKNPASRRLDHKERFKGWEYAVIDKVDSFDKSEWKPLEIYWIEQFRQWGYTLINKNKGGGGFDGWRTEEEIRQYKKNSARQWYLDNPLKCKTRHKNHYSANKEIYYKQSRQWRLDNREKYNEHQRQCYARKKNAGG